MSKSELETYHQRSMIGCCLRWISPHTTPDDGFAVNRDDGFAVNRTAEQTAREAPPPRPGRPSAVAAGGYVQGGVAVEEAEGLEPEGDDVDGHHRPVLWSGDVVDAEH